jgi:hypothetical protein
MSNDKKYPMLYVQRLLPGFGGKHLDAYDLNCKEVHVGTEKLTDLLDELYTLRLEKIVMEEERQSYER